MLEAFMKNPDVFYIFLNDSGAVVVGVGVFDGVDEEYIPAPGGLVGLDDPDVVESVAFEPTPPPEAGVVDLKEYLKRLERGFAQIGLVGLKVRI